VSRFEDLREIIDLMSAGEHRRMHGIAVIAEITQTMNQRRPSEVLRILRDHTPTTSGDLEVMRWSGPYGDVGRPAETTGPPSTNVHVHRSFK
jgi:hypothetical protein